MIQPCSTCKGVGTVDLSNAAGSIYGETLDPEKPPICKACRGLGIVEVPDQHGPPPAPVARDNPGGVNWEFWTEKESESVDPGD